MLVTPFRDRKGRVAASVEGIFCHFEREAVPPPIGMPVPVMICLAAARRYVEDYHAMDEAGRAENPPRIPFLVVRAVTADDRLVTVAGFARTSPRDRPRAFLPEETRAAIHQAYGIAPRYLTPGRSPVIEEPDATAVCRAYQVYVAGADLRAGFARVTGLPGLDAVDPAVVALLTRREEGRSDMPPPRRTVDTLTSRRGKRSA